MAPAIAVVVMVIAAIAAPKASESDPTSAVVEHLCLLVALAAAVVVVVTRARDAAKPWIVGLLAGTYLAAAATIHLSGSPFPLLGTGVDQGFHIAQIEHFTRAWTFSDYSYKGLPAFYPPLFFWVAGHFAAANAMPAYQAAKVGMIAIAFVVPLATVGLWRLITPRRALVIAVVATTVVLPDWYAPYEWLAVAIFVPWWLAFVLQVGRDRPLSRGQLAVGMVIGAVLVTLYYYWLVVGLVQLASLLVARSTAHRHGFDLPPARPRQCVTVLAGTAAISSIYWLPLVLKIVTTPGARSLQNRFYGAGDVPIPTRFLDFDLIGAAMLAGLVYLLLTARRSPLSFALLTLLGAAYVWFALGYVGVLVGFPLLTGKLSDLVGYTLLVGAAIGAVEAVRVARDRGLADEGREGVLFAAATLGVILVGFFAQQAVATMPWVKEQQEARVPTETLRDVAVATRGRYAGKVFLTDLDTLPEYLPVSTFNTWSANYANPAGLFEQRARFLRRVASERDPAVVAAALRRNRFDRVDWIALRPGERGFDYSYAADAFPNGTSGETIHFPTDRFATLDRYPGAVLTLFRVRSVELTPDEEAELVSHFPGDLAS